MSVEIWKPIDGYEGRYEASTLGRIRSIDFVDHAGRKHAGKVITQYESPSGYMSVRLFCRGVRYHKTVHRLVATTFIANHENKSDVNHINGDKHDNRIENLEWSTRSENILHSFRVLKRRKGQPPWKGKSCPYTRKLTDEQVRAIRKDKRNRSVIANEYGVSKATIYRVLNGECYKHVLGE